MNISNDTISILVVNLRVVYFTFDNAREIYVTAIQDFFLVVLLRWYCNGNYAKPCNTIHSSPTAGA